MTDTVLFHALQAAGSSITLVLTCAALLLAAKFVLNLLVPYALDQELTQHDNPAVALSLVGYLLAAAIILVSALSGPSRGLTADVLDLCLYGSLGIVLLNISRLCTDKLLLRGFCNTTALVKERNMAAATVNFGASISAGLVVAGALHGEGGGVHTAVAFFGLSQLVLLGGAWLYNKLTPFDAQQAVQQGSTAAGLSFAGTLMGWGILLMLGSSGNFVGWRYDLTAFGLTVVVGGVCLPLARWLFDRLLLPGADLNAELTRDNNTGVGVLEMAAMVAMAAVIAMVLDVEPWARWLAADG